MGRDVLEEARSSDGRAPEPLNSRALPGPCAMRGASIAVSQCDSKFFGGGKMEHAESIAVSRGCGVFTPAEAVEAFSALFLDEKVCTLWVLKRLHPEGARCPECKAAVGYDDGNFWEMKRCHCKECGKWFTATTGAHIARRSTPARRAVSSCSPFRPWS